MEPDKNGNRGDVSDVAEVPDSEVGAVYGFVRHQQQPVRSTFHDYSQTTPRSPHRLASLNDRPNLAPRVMETVSDDNEIDLKRRRVVANERPVGTGSSQDPIVLDLDDDEDDDDEEDYNDVEGQSQHMMSQHSLLQSSQVQFGQDQHLPTQPRQIQPQSQSGQIQSGLSQPIQYNHSSQHSSQHLSQHSSQRSSQNANHHTHHTHHASQSHSVQTIASVKPEVKSNEDDEIVFVGEVTKANADTHSGTSADKYVPSPGYEEKERAYVPAQLYYQEIKGRYGPVANVTKDLIVRADQLVSEIDRMINKLARAKLVLMKTENVATIECQRNLEFLSTNLEYLRTKNRSMFKDAEKLRHNNREVLKEWGYKLDIRHVYLINEGHPRSFPPLFKMNMLKVDLRGFKSNFKEIYERIKALKTKVDQIIPEAGGAFDMRGNPVLNRRIDDIVQLDPNARPYDYYDSQFQSTPSDGLHQMPGSYPGVSDAVVSSVQPPGSFTDEFLFNNDMFGQARDRFTQTNVYDQDERSEIQTMLESLRPDEEFVEGMEATPKEFRIQLYDHQRIGLAWMKAQEESVCKGGILADDMGLGKTIQAMAIMFANRSQDKGHRTNLVVAPVSLLHQWQSEVKRRANDDAQFSTFIWYRNQRTRSFQELKQYDMVLISYTTLASEWKRHYHSEIEEIDKGQLPEGAGGSKYRSPFYTQDAYFYRVVLDEAQNIKNKLTNASRSVAMLKTDYRWCLSGTPMQNGVHELYPLLRFLRYKPYNKEEKFKSSILTPIQRDWDSRHAYRRLHVLLKTILLRRSKDSKIDGKPIITLPEKHMVVDSVSMTAGEHDFYKNLEAKSAAKAKSLMQNGEKGLGSYSSILTLLLRMRQACDHYYMVEISDDPEGAEVHSDYSNMYKGCIKLDDQAKNTINRTIHDKEMTCLVCDDLLTPSSVRFLNGCGHIICKECLKTYFEDNSDVQEEGRRTAHCPACGKKSLEAMCFSLEVYQAAVVEQLSWKRCVEKFGIGNKMADKFARQKKLKELIRRDEGLANSAKIVKCLEILNNILIKYPGEKVIIFSQFTTFFDILQRLLRHNGLKYLRYDGTMDLSEKNSTVDQFYQDPTEQIMLVSLKAGSVGLTLTCANHVILLEPFWNPYVEMQAQDRVHRISQRKEVFVHRILVEGTVEDRIMELQKKKQTMVELALDPSARSKIGRLSTQELGYLFGLNQLS